MVVTIAAATCLALNVYFEARNQPTDGQYLIAEVTMNRVNDDRYPDNVCDVVWQGKQFSWTHDGKPDTPKNRDAWLKAQIIAYSVILYGCEICTEATHYHTINVKPYWSRKLTKLGMYGDHIFYQWEHK
jgi:spore germination cell wall hydrolase CwlJ-like protein